MTQALPPDRPGITVEDFEDIDDSGKPQAYIEILEAFDRLPGLQVLKTAAIERCRIGPGMLILDAGCGFGLETARLAGLVAPSGRVVGVDVSHEFVAEAERRARTPALPIDYQVGDVERLGLADDLFDVARAERLFLYLDDPRRAFGELVRVTRPDGAIYVIEPDFETMTVNLDDRALVRKALHFECDRHTRQGWIGRHLPGLFKSFGLVDLDVQASVIVFDPDIFPDYFIEIGQSARRDGVLNDRESRSWRDGIRRLQQDDSLFCTITYFLMSGRKRA